MTNYSALHKRTNKCVLSTAVEAVVAVTGWTVDLRSDCRAGIGRSSLAHHITGHLRLMSVVGPAWRVGRGDGSRIGSAARGSVLGTGTPTQIPITPKPQKACPKCFQVHTEGSASKSTRESVCSSSK